MATTTFMQPFGGGMDWLIVEIRKRFPEITGVAIYPNVNQPGNIVVITSRDHGIWEWNEEVISDEMSGSGDL